MLFMQSLVSFSGCVPAYNFMCSTEALFAESYFVRSLILSLGMYSLLQSCSGIQRVHVFIHFRQTCICSSVRHFRLSATCCKFIQCLLLQILLYCSGWVWKINFYLPSVVFVIHLCKLSGKYCMELVHFAHCLVTRWWGKDRLHAAICWFY